MWKLREAGRGRWKIGLRLLLPPPPLSPRLTTPPPSPTLPARLCCRLWLRNRLALPLTWSPKPLRPLHLLSSPPWCRQPLLRAPLSPLWPPLCPCLPATALLRLRLRPRGQPLFTPPRRRLCCPPLGQLHPSVPLTRRGVPVPLLQRHEGFSLLWPKHRLLPRCRLPLRRLHRSRTKLRNRPVSHQILSRG